MTFLSAADVRPFDQAKVRKKNKQLYEEIKTRKLKGKREKRANSKECEGREKTERESGKRKQR